MLTLLAFENAFEQLRRLTGDPVELEWIFRGDVAMVGRSLLVTDRDRDERTRVAREAYACGTRGLGVELAAVGHRDEVVYCTAWEPTSERDAECRLIAGLKLSKLDALLPVHEVHAHEWRRVSAAHTGAQLGFLDALFQHR